MKILHVTYQIKQKFNASNNFTCINALLNMFGPWCSINGLYWTGVKNGKYEILCDMHICTIKHFGLWGTINWWNWGRGDVKNEKYVNAAHGVSN